MSGSQPDYAGQVASTPRLIFTDSAATKVAALITEEENPALMLRVSITGGGCSGFQYGFTFAETQEVDDHVIEKTVNDTSVKLLVDAMSYQYLVDAEIDFRDDLQGERFIIRNPNAKTTCGCGSSFSIDEDAAT